MLTHNCIYQILLTVFLKFCYLYFSNSVNCISWILGVIGKQREDGCFGDPAQGEVNTVLERGSAPRTTEEN